MYAFKYYGLDKERESAVFLSFVVNFEPYRYIFCYVLTFFLSKRKSNDAFNAVAFCTWDVYKNEIHCRLKFENGAMRSTLADKVFT